MINQELGRGFAHSRPRRGIASAEAAFRPSPELLSMTRRDWQQLMPERYEAHFAHSAVSLAGYEGLMRNIRCLTAQDENE